MSDVFEPPAVALLALNASLARKRWVDGLCEFQRVCLDELAVVAEVALLGRLAPALGGCEDPMMEAFAEPADQPARRQEQQVAVAPAQERPLLERGAPPGHVHGGVRSGGELLHVPLSRRADQVQHLRFAIGQVQLPEQPVELRGPE
jgi:hypothetical protein